MSLVFFYLVCKVLFQLDNFKCMDVLMLSFLFIYSSYGVLVTVLFGILLSMNAAVFSIFFQSDFGKEKRLIMFFITFLSILFRFSVMLFMLGLSGIMYCSTMLYFFKNFAKSFSCCLFNLLYLL